MPYMGDPNNYPPCTDCGTTKLPRYWAYYFAGRCVPCINKWIESLYPGLKYKENPFLAMVKKDAGEK